MKLFPLQEHLLGDNSNKDLNDNFYYNVQGNLELITNQIKKLTLRVEDLKHSDKDDDIVSNLQAKKKNTMKMTTNNTQSSVDAKDSVQNYITKEQNRLKPPSGLKKTLINQHSSLTLQRKQSLNEIKNQTKGSLVDLLDESSILN
jgi:hypothetical protein